MTPPDLDKNPFWTGNLSVQHADLKVVCFCHSPYNVHHAYLRINLQQHGNDLSSDCSTQKSVSVDPMTAVSNNDTCSMDTDSRYQQLFSYYSAAGEIFLYH